MTGRFAFVGTAFFQIIYELTRQESGAAAWRDTEGDPAEAGGLSQPEPAEPASAFPRWTRYATKGCCSSIKLQRTATVELHNCLKKGRSPSHKDQEFLADLVTHLRPDLVESARRILEDPYPGYDIGRKKVGCLFPDYVVMSNLQGLRYDDELKL